jgi:hypothetical protein
MIKYIPTMRPAITLHCPLCKVMLLEIGNPPSPLMCCLKLANNDWPYKRLCLFRPRRPWCMVSTIHLLEKCVCVTKCEARNGQIIIIQGKYK